MALVHYVFGGIFTFLIWGCRIDSSPNVVGDKSSNPPVVNENHRVTASSTSHNIVRGRPSATTARRGGSKPVAKSHNAKKAPTTVKKVVATPNRSSVSYPRGEGEFNPIDSVEGLNDKAPPEHSPMDVDFASANDPKGNGEFNRVGRAKDLNVLVGKSPNRSPIVDEFSLANDPKGNSEFNPIDDNVNDIGDESPSSEDSPNDDESSSVNDLDEAFEANNDHSSLENIENDSVIPADDVNYHNDADVPANELTDDDEESDTPDNNHLPDPDRILLPTTDNVNHKKKLKNVSKGRFDESISRFGKDLRMFWITQQLSRIQTSSMDAWIAIGGPDFLELAKNGGRKSIFKRVRKAIFTEDDSEANYKRIIRLLYLASELAWLKPKEGLTKFDNNSDDAKNICSLMLDANFLKVFAQNIAFHLFVRGQRNKGFEYEYQWGNTKVKDRHPLANLPYLCKIPKDNHDLVYGIVNHRIGRVIGQKVIPKDLTQVFRLDSSTNINVKKALLLVGNGGAVTLLYGPMGDRGMIRDWYTNLVTKLLNSSKYFEQDEDGTYRLSGSAFDDTSDNHIVFRGIGKLLAMSLIEGFPWGVVLNRTFYIILLNRMKAVNALTRKDLRLDDKSYYDSWKYYGDCMAKGSVSCAAALAGVPPVMTSHDGKRQFVPNGDDVSVTVDNVNDYAQQLLQDRLFTMHEMKYKEILAGFNELIPKHILNFVTVENLRRFLQGPGELSAEELNEAISWPFSGHYAKGNTGYIHLNELFDSESQDFRNAFVQFSTSLKTPPLAGFVENAYGVGKIILVEDLVERDQNSIPRPSSHTCFFTVQIPKYDDKPMLKQMLEEAFKNNNFAYSAVEQGALQAT